MSLKEEICKNLIYFRKLKRMSQKELAERMGLKNSTVSNWEQGRNTMDIDTLLQACDILDVTFDDMFGPYAETAKSHPPPPAPPEIPKTR